jgi:ribosomal protein L5
MLRFHLHYCNIVSYDFLFKDHFINVMQFPKLNHIVLNSGLGLQSLLPSGLFTVLLGLESITSRRPLITRSKKSIDQFKLRVHTPLGCKLTLRSSPSFFFFHRLVHFVLPRLEDLSFLSPSVLSPSSDLCYSRLPFSRSSPFFPFSSATLSLPNNLNTPLASSLILPPFPLYKRFSSSLFVAPRQDLASSAKLLSFFRFLRFHTFFLPFFKSYFILPFSDSLLTFFLDHSFTFSFFLPASQRSSTFLFDFPASSSTLLSSSLSDGLPSFFSQRSFSKGSFYSFSFGLSDFFTSFSTDFDKFHSSYGLDITFVIRFSKHRSLSHPFYFLSFFQFPLVP